MFDKKSLQVLNKKNPDAIVCSNAAGNYVHITRADFDTEDEFLFWKNLSDNEYEEAEHDGRKYYDNNVSLDEDINVGSESLEDKVIAAIDRVTYDRKRAKQLEQVRSILTKTQFRRLWKYHVMDMTEQEIADSEGVGQRRISTSITAAKKKTENFFEIPSKEGAKNG